MTNVVPAELEMLRSELDTARVVTDAAYSKFEALTEQHSEISEALRVAQEELARADDAELQARNMYRAALRDHGYVETAAGPKPKAVDAASLPTWRPDVETDAPGATAHRATGTGGQVEIQCCGVWIDYPAPGRDERCSVCGSTFTVGGWPASAGGVVQTRDGAAPLTPGRHEFRFQP